MVPAVAAVIVAYRSGAFLEACLDALAGRVRETVVVDNCPEARSGPGLRGRFPGVAWVDSDRNGGFAAGVNRGVAATTAPHVLLLNPDCELLTGIEDLVSACQDGAVAGAGGLLVDADGAPQSGFFARRLPTPAVLACEAAGANGLWPANPLNRRYRMLDMRPEEARDVQQPAGAFLLLRRDCLARVGGLDERFAPVWFEDVDLCKRLSDAGYRLRYVPTAVARHAGGHSVAALPEGERVAAWYGGLLRYARKHFPRGTYGIVRTAVMLGLALRALGCCATRSFDRAAAHVAMLRRVALGPRATAGQP